jgi:ATP-binding cassette subfamily B protein
MKKPVNQEFTRFKALARSHVRGLALLAFLSLVAGVLGILFPYLARPFIDSLGAKEAWGKFVRLSLAGVVIGGLRWGIGALSSFVSARVREGIICDLRCRVSDGFLRLPLLRAEEKGSGEIITTLFGDAGNVAGFLVGQLPSMLTAVVQFLGVMGILLLWDPIIAVVALLGAPVYIWTSVRRTGDLGDLYRSIQETRSRLARQLVILTQGIRVVKGVAREDEEYGLFTENARGIQVSNIRMNDRNLQISARLKLLSYVAGLVMMIVGGWRVWAGHISMGQLIAIMGFLAFLRAPLDQASALGRNLHVTRAGLKRIEDVLSGEKENLDGKEMEKIDGPVSLQDVCFSYGNGVVLEDFSLEIGPKEVVGLKGPSGVGKTTVALVAAGLLKPSKGRVAVNGVSLDALNLKAYRKRVGLVFQKEFLGNGTIRENIAYGRPDASDDEIRGAARIACIHDFIEGLPQGYGTPLGEEGRGLSEGQRQRIAIARAVLMEPDIFVLDEATSALDISTEDRVVKNIMRLGKGVLLISHRETALSYADRVVEMKNGWGDQRN